MPWPHLGACRGRAAGPVSHPPFCHAARWCSTLGPGVTAGNLILWADECQRPSLAADPVTALSLAGSRMAPLGDAPKHHLGMMSWQVVLSGDGCGLPDR